MDGDRQARSSTSLVGRGRHLEAQSRTAVGACGKPVVKGIIVMQHLFFRTT